MYKTPLRRTGDDQPCPLIGVFHATLSVADHLIGSLVAVLVPSPEGPRKLAQSAPNVDDSSNASTEKMVSVVRIFKLNRCMLPDLRELNVGIKIRLTLALNYATGANRYEYIIARMENKCANLSSLLENRTGTQQWCNGHAGQTY